jgi:lipoate-protein ligase A
LNSWPDNADEQEGETQRLQTLIAAQRSPKVASMRTICRVLPHWKADGPSNMAIDEALLDSVAFDPSMAVVRTYEWSIPTLSLGYFQRTVDFESDSRWSTVPIVRRPTGGGALWHDIEVTYAVVIPGHHPFARPSRALYRAIHDSIAHQIRLLGIPASLRGTPEIDEELESRPRPFLCFNDRDEEDVVFRNAKLVGSAQRRRSGAILQHGSLLLGRSKTTPELPGLSDLAPILGSTEKWVPILRTLLAETLNLPVVEDELRPDEIQKAENLRQTIYSDPLWTLRR